jgi:hypothetical protein
VDKRMGKKTSRCLSFGALVDPIGKQVPELDKEVATQFQEDMEAIIRLYIRGIISDKERERGYTRLAKKITAAISRAREEKG